VQPQQNLQKHASQESDVEPVSIPIRKKGRWIRWFLLVAASAAAFFITISIGLVFAPSFELLELQSEGVILSAGNGKSVPIGIKRLHGFREGVNLEVLTAGNGLTVVATDIATDSDNGELRLNVSADASPGVRRVDVRATAKGGPEKMTSLQVVVLPPGFEAIGETPPDGGAMPYPSKIGRRVGGQQVVFVLIRPEGESDAPFYLMENKVSNGVFRAFARDNPQAVGLLWKQRGVANDRNVGDDDELPVFRVTRPEAQRCAAWLGGRLPTAQQLDRAFGYDDWRNGRRSPPPPKVEAVNPIQQGPRKITDSDDLSPYGIRDLASNGLEWTRDYLISKDGKWLAVLRGRSYTASEPLSLADVDKWNKDPAICPVQFPEHPSRTTSFRVVIEIPPYRRASDQLTNAAWKPR
jgi:hypothetical protein